ncbi:MAG TPA: helix-turn-helix domain-containing protein [Candidatus Obscuribacterales bacterium]
MGQPDIQRAFFGASVEGLDHVFVDVVDAEVCQGTPSEEGIPQEIPEGDPMESQEIPQGIPVQEAAKLLGTSPRAVIKRLQKGTLKGFKVPSKFGNKWLVDPQGIPAEEQGIPQEIPEGTPTQIPQGVPVEIVQELLAKVEALTYRNGYLEAQLAQLTCWKSTSNY